MPIYMYFLIGSFIWWKTLTEPSCMRAWDDDKRMEWKDPD